MLLSVAASQAIEGVEKIQALGDRGSIIPSKERRALSSDTACVRCAQSLPSVLTKRTEKEGEAGTGWGEGGAPTGKMES